MTDINEHSVWSQYLSARQARKVARALKEAGYGTVTIKDCRAYVINLARYLEPMDGEARHKVLRIICEAAGIQPGSE